MSQNESFRVAGSPHVSQPSGFAALASRWLTSMGSPATTYAQRAYPKSESTRRVGGAFTLGDGEHVLVFVLLTARSFITPALRVASAVLPPRC